MHCRSISGEYLLVTLLSSGVLIPPPLLHAEEAPPFSSDRPGKADGSTVLPAGTAQIEVGWTYSEDDEKDVNTSAHAFPETLLRLGLLDRAELRLAFAGYQWIHTDPDGPDDPTRDEGAGDLGVAAKVFLFAETGLLPESAFLTGVSLPTGADDLSSHRVDPFFRFSHTHGLTDSISLNYNWGVGWASALDDDGHDRNTLASFQYTFGLGAALSEEISAFLEVFGDVPMTAGGGSSHTLDGGFTWLAADRLQVDLSAGVGLTQEAGDWFVSAGFTWRFPR